MEIKFEIADQENIKKQIEDSDIVYLCGEKNVVVKRFEWSEKFKEYF